MKWTELKSFSFKDLISIIIVVTFVSLIIFYSLIGFFTKEYPQALFELIKVVVTPISWVLGIYGGTEGLELIKGKLEGSEFLNMPVNNNTNTSINDSNSI